MKTEFLLRLLAGVAVASAGLLGADNTETAPSSRSVNYNAPAPKSIPLRRVQADSIESTLARRSLALKGDQPLGRGYTELRNMNSVYYVVDITVGNGTFAVLIDTGSSDTWLIHKEFKCVSMFESPRSQASCGFGPSYNGDFSPANLQGEQFGRMYGDGTFVIGLFGYEDVTIGGITVNHQQLAIVNYTYWYGDGKSSGLLGLAYPLMTGIDENVKEYNPLFTSMWKQGLAKAEFTIALTRKHVGAPEDAEGSYLAFGGVPPVTYDKESWATTPLLKMRSLKEYYWLEKEEEGFYIVMPQAMVYGKGTSTTKGGQSDEFVTDATDLLPLVVDAGSTFTVLPTKLVDKIFKYFEDPPIWVGSGASYYARCDQKPAAFGIKLGGKTYFMNPADMLRQEQRDLETGKLCRVGLYDRGVGPYTLGVSFLTNVVAVFDVGKTEMRFAAREKY